MRVKICGMTSADDALAATDAGADAIGCLVGVDGDPADQLDAGAARRVFEALPPFVGRVLVTHRIELEEVAALARATAASVVQLHGPYPLDAIPALRGLLPRLAILKSVHVTGESALAEARAAADVADAVLLDSRTGDRIGGTGVVHDWSISARIVAALTKPVILAGGLTPGNVAEAIARVHPWAVDVNTGTKGPDGRKSQARIRAFVAAARGIA